MFKFLLMLKDGEPTDPAALITAIPNWTLGETFTTGCGEERRILAIKTEIADELVEGGFNAVFTVAAADAAMRSRPR